MRTEALTSARPRIDNGGFSLVEVMIAVVILVLGLLGILAVIINSLKLSSSSNYRSVAAIQANAIADTLRANPATLASAGTAASFSSPTAAQQLNCLKAAGCLRDDYVNNQLWLWQAQLASSLPGGAGVICRDSAPVSHSPTQQANGTIASWQCDGTGQFVVKICWNEARIAASSPSVGAGSLLCTWSSI